MQEQIIDTKKGLQDFLQERLRWFIDHEPNPFVESRMVFYINNGLNALYEIDVPEDTKIIMYDEDDVLKFKVEA